VIGFNEEDFRQIQKLLTDNGAIVKIIDLTGINEEYNSTTGETCWNIAIMDISSYKTYESLIDKFKCPVTSTDWVEDCVIQAEFYWPNKQLINKGYETKHDQKNRGMKIKMDDVDEMFETIECANNQFRF